ncbi:MAG: DUF1614 domain-containing protein [Thermoplasmatales archaeon]|nr:DUF1614 domain-containing protein [Thermoplasmatales archaeon]
MLATSVLTQISAYVLYILLPLLALYIGYLIITKAFNDMDFTSFEAIIIVFVSFLLGSGIVDEYIGFSFSNIHLFVYGNWIVGINTGGAVIPIILSIYLSVKNKLQLSRILLGTIIVAVITYFVTEPIPQKGIVAKFPFWLLPVFFASLASIILSWKDKRKAAPLAYISGTMGVLIGADFLHLISLIETEIQTTRNAVIGGASVFDMVFITGILAVIVDGILIYRERKG